MQHSPSSIGLCCAATLLLALIVAIAATPTEAANCNASQASGWSSTAGSGQIRTNPTQATYNPSEDCTWTIDCSNVNMSIAILVHLNGHTHDSSDSLSIYDDGANKLIYNEYGFIKRSVLLRFTKARLHWVTSLLNGSRGVTIDYTCQTSICSTTGPVVATNITTTGTLKSDVDGKECERSYAAGEECDYKFECRSGSGNYVAITASGETISKDTITYDGVASTAFSGRFDRQKYISASPAAAKFIAHSGTAATTSGFDLDYQCVNSRCSSTNANTAFSATSGTIMSDSDGHKGGDVYGQNDDCSYVVKCPIGNAIKLTAQVDTNTFDNLEIKDAVNSQTFSFSGSQTRTFFSHNNQVDIKFKPVSGKSGYGWTLNYTCTSSPCDATSVSYAGGATVVESDADGSGTASNYVENSKCQWNVNCPNADDTIAYAIKKGSLAGDDKIQVLNGTSPFTNIGNYSESSPSITTYGRVQYIDGVGKAQFHFTGSGSGFGFTLYYVCQPAVCSSPNLTMTSFTTTSGLIVSNLDYLVNKPTIPKSSFDHRKENCNWTISCPAGSAIVVSALLPYNPNPYSFRLHGVKDDVTTDLGTVTSSGSVQHNLLDYPKLYVVWSSVSNTYSNRAFTSSWECVTGMCTSVNSTATTYTDNSGTLFAGDGVGFYNNENCTWKIQCPTGQYPLIEVSAAGSSSYTIYNESWSVIRTYTSTSAWKTFADTNVAHVRLLTSGTSTTAKPYAKWECMANRCSSKTLPYELTNSYRAVSFTSSIANELCPFSITCPAGTTRIALHTTSSGGLSAFASIKFDNDGDSLASFTDKVYASTTALSGNWETGVDTSKFGTSNIGSGSFSYVCLTTNTNCTGSVDNGTTLTAGNGMIQGTQDGTGISAYSLTNEDCVYEITCPSGSTSRITTLVQIRSVVGNFKLRYLDNNNTYQNYLSRTSAYNALDVWTYNSGMQLTWQTSSAVRGFTFDYSCASTYCSAVKTASGTTYTASSGTIQTDDGLYGENYKRGEDCSWKIQCPTGYSYVRLYVRGNLNTGATLAAKIPDGTTYTLPASTTAYYFVVDNSTVDVTFKTSSSIWTTPGSGAKIDYRCHKNQCSLTNFNQRQSVTDRRGLVQSTSYGLAAFNEDCEWTIECPAGMYAAVNHLAYKALRDDVLTLTSPNGTCWTYNAESPLPYTDIQALLVGENYLRVRWQTGSVPRSGQQGFVLQYSCATQKTCSSSSPQVYEQDVNVQANVFGNVASDFDGYTATAVIPYATEEDCMWTFKCATNYTLSFADIKGNTAPGDHLEFLNFDGTQKYRRLDGMFDQKNFFPLGGKSARVQFKRYGNNAIPADGGFQFAFRCVNETFAVCRSAQGSGTLAVSTDSLNMNEVVTDVDGNYTDGLNYNHSQTCFWNVQCPSSRDSLLVNVTGSLHSSDTYEVSGVDELYTGTGEVKDQLYYMRHPFAQIVFKADGANSDKGMNFSYKCICNGASSTMSVSLFALLAAVVAAFVF